MKRSIFTWVVVIVAIGAFALSGCENSAQTDGMQINQVDAEWMPSAESVEELPLVSDLIIVFEPTSQENALSHFSDGLVENGYTKTSGIAQRVLKGTVEEGSTVQITEVCYTTNSGSELWTIGGYLPMEIGQKYLLFLTAYDAESPYSGMYYPINMEYGKYALPSNSNWLTSLFKDKNELWEIGNATNLDQYADWYAYVQDLYPDLF